MNSLSYESVIYPEKITKNEGNSRQCAKHIIDKLMAVLSENSCVTFILIGVVHFKLLNLIIQI